MSFTLVLGGARSGKSRYAESLITAFSPPWTYIATAQAFDAEMQARIALHRDRRSAGWITCEAPLDLPTALQVPHPVLVDCLSMWLSNLLLAEQDCDTASSALEQAVLARTDPTVLVACEVGLGIVPDNALARRFRDVAGSLNQRLAASAARVVFVAAGLPLMLKNQEGGDHDAS